MLFVPKYYIVSSVLGRAINCNQEKFNFRTTTHLHFGGLVDSPIVYSNICLCQDDDVFQANTNINNCILFLLRNITHVMFTETMFNSFPDTSKLSVHTVCTSRLCLCVCRNAPLCTPVCCPLCAPWLCIWSVVARLDYFSSFLQLNKQSTM